MIKDKLYSTYLDAICDKVAERTVELSGIPPLSFTAKGKPLTAWSIIGNMVQNGTPTPENPVEVQGVGDYDSETGLYRIPVVTKSDGTEPITTPIYLDSPLYKIGDYADRLSKTEEVRVVKELVLTGKERWDLWNGNYFSSVIDRKGAIDTLVCSHFINSSANGISYGRSAILGLKIAAVAIPFVTSVSELKTWLATQYAAGTPVKVYYVLATPETKPVEPVEIPTLNGTTVIDVDTAVKPESMTIKYKGV